MKDPKPVNPPRKQKHWTCGTCKGSGQVRVWFVDKAGKRQYQDNACGVCGGKGRISW